MSEAGNQFPCFHVLAGRMGERAMSCTGCLQLESWLAHSPRHRDLYGPSLGYQCAFQPRQ